MSSPAYRYGPWHDGPDPLAPPYDVAGALDELGDAVLDGQSPAEALRDLMRRGLGDRSGLDELRRRVRERQREARQRGRLDGTLERVKELLAEAVQSERSALFGDPSDDARFRESQLDALPRDPARAVRELAEYDWRSEAARQSYEEIRDLLRREVLDSQFRGMKQALEQAGTDPDAMARVKDMLADLNAMLEADARGEDVTERFTEFMARHGDFFPDNPQNLTELIDSLARRAAAASRLLASLSAEQRAELADLMATALADMDLASEMSALASALAGRRPDLDWSGRERMRGQPMGLGEATDALEELAELDELENALAQNYPGAHLDDVDEEAVARALGRSAVDDLQALRRIERALEEQGYLQRDRGRLELSPKAVRRIGSTALRRVFSRLEAHRTGAHDVADAGAAGELTGSSREWRFGDEQPLDVVRTLRNAVLRGGASGAGPVRLHVEDFEVVETERRTVAAVALLVDLSYSMVVRGTWGTAKSTALALHSLVSTRFPTDALTIIGFSNYARTLRADELAGLSWEDQVQGTNLQHALMLAGRHLAQYPDAEPVVMVVTDGEPTAHLMPDGQAIFWYPPLPDTLELTLAEVDRLTRRKATINVFLLDDDPRLAAFVDGIARRNGGRVFSPAYDRLGDYIVSDYLRRRRGR